jgi:hypothetical protein
MVPLASASGLAVIGGSISLALLAIWWLLRGEAREYEEEQAAEQEAAERAEADATRRAAGDWVSRR